MNKEKNILIHQIAKNPNPPSRIILKNISIIDSDGHSCPTTIFSYDGSPVIHVEADYYGEKVLYTSITNSTVESVRNAIVDIISNSTGLTNEYI